MVRTEVLPDGVSSKMLEKVELFTPMDSVLGLQPINLEMTIYITTPDNTVWFCTLHSPLLRPLLASYSQVPVF